MTSAQMQKLTPFERHVAWLYGTHRLTIGETARQLQCTSEEVKRVVDRLSMRGLLQRDEDEDEA